MGKKELEMCLEDNKKELDIIIDEIDENDYLYSYDWIDSNKTMMTIEDFGR